MTDATPAPAPSTTWEEIQSLRLYSWSWHDEDEETGLSDEQKIAEHLVSCGDLNLSEESYSFNLMGFWVRKETGQILYGTDSGCSCPSPWESTDVRDLKETTLDRVPALARENAHVGCDDWGAIDPARFDDSVRSMVARLKEAGGK